MTTPTPPRTEVPTREEIAHAVEQFRTACREDARLASRCLPSNGNEDAARSSLLASVDLLYAALAEARERADDTVAACDAMRVGLEQARAERDRAVMERDEARDVADPKENDHG